MGKSETAEAATPKSPGLEQHKAPENRDGPEKSAQAGEVDKISEVRAHAYAPGGDAHANLGSRTKESGNTILPSFGIDFSSDKMAARLDKAREIKSAEYKNPNMSEEGQALVRQAEKAILKPGYPNAGKELLKFAQDVEQFEKLSRLNGISPEEVKKTYKGIDDLLKSAAPTSPGVTGDGMPSARQRVRVAEQLMNMVAHPEDRNQGNFDTCAMATVEGMLLTGKNAEPSRVTNMVSEVALSGQTKAGDLTVKVDKQSMLSFGEHADNRPVGDDRQRLAENIFRLAAANTYFALRKQEGHAEGQLHYVSGKDGNQVIYKRDQALPHDAKLAERNKPGEEIRGAHEASTAVAGSRILKQITGKDFKDRIFVNTNAEDSDPNWVTEFSNAKEMDDLLKKAKEEGRLPITLGVFTSNQLFSKGENIFSEMDDVDDEKEAGSVIRDMLEDGHAILVTDRREGPLGAQYDIKNTWGAKSNIQTWSSPLYESTEQLRPTKVIEQLDKWYKGHKAGDKEHTERYVLSLFLTSATLNKQVGELPNGGTPSHQKDLQLANLQMRANYQALPVETRREVEKHVAKQIKSIKDTEQKALVQETLDRLTK